LLACSFCFLVISPKFDPALACCLLLAFFPPLVCLCVCDFSPCISCSVPFSFLFDGVAAGWGKRLVATKPFCLHFCVLVLLLCCSFLSIPTLFQAHTHTHTHIHTHTYAHYHSSLRRGGRRKVAGYTHILIKIYNSPPSFFLLPLHLASPFLAPHSSRICVCVWFVCVYW
jgi:hypothetical protein